jgi:hypothetical protein
MAPVSSVVDKSPSASSGRLAGILFKSVTFGHAGLVFLAVAALTETLGFGARIAFNSAKSTFYACSAR